jgi:hypothetical protein
MLAIVTTWNARNQPPELIMMTTKAIQTNIEDNEDVIIIHIDHMSSLKVDKKKLSYVTKCKHKRKASTIIS